MKNRIQTLGLILASMCFVMLMSVGCTSDPVDETDPIDKYLGVWLVSDQPDRLNYEVTISRNPSNTAEILFDNFADFGEPVSGLVVGTSVIIDRQEVSNDFYVEGTGTFIDTEFMEFSYDLFDGIDNQKRKCTYTK